MKIVALTVLAVLPLLVTAILDLESEYPFRATLLNDVDNQGQLLYYALYWNFNIPEETIQFAVNVSTTGWVGFGVSSNGQMPGSDVVMGWVVEDGTTHFHDHFADTRALPPIDESQDWFLISGEEENGFTILEFSRNWTTCDEMDLDADTARVVWSYQANDPTDPLGNTATFHDRMGSTSLNLLGGITNPPPDPDDVMSFDVGATNVIIPNDTDTTYWCAISALPPEITSQEKYITRISPYISPHAKQYVHHMVVYLCPFSLNSSNAGHSGECDETPDEVRRCLGGLLVAAWAVGGEDFIYPENVAYPIGGSGADMHVVIQMHYDNPNLDSGVMDSSGVRFFYTSTPRQHRAGILSIGHNVQPIMIVPPGAKNYTVAGVCASECTQSFFPEDGIHVFGDMFHTHLAGNGLTLRHLRWSEECGGFEELKPIDQNLRYDFNFQQITHLPREIAVQPNDTLILECYYNTTGRRNITLGGERTLEEMCLVFPVYYPRLDGAALDSCISQPLTTFDDQGNVMDIPAVADFLTKYGGSNPVATQQIIQGDLFGGFNAFNWSQTELVEGLENSVLHSGIQGICVSEKGLGFPVLPNGLPEVACPYQPPNVCTAGAASLVSHVMIILSMVLFSLLF